MFRCLIQQQLLRRSFLALLGLPVVAHGLLLDAQSSVAPAHAPDETWAGKRIVMLNSFGDYFSPAESVEPRLIKASGLSVNVVAVVRSVDGNRVWIKANGGGDAAVGW